MWDVKKPTHYSKRVGHEVPGVVAVLCESIEGPHQLIAAKTQPAQSNIETTTTKEYDTDSDAEYHIADNDEEDSLDDSVLSSGSYNAKLANGPSRPT